MSAQQATAPAIRPVATHRTRNLVPPLVTVIVVLAIAVVSLGAALAAPTLTTSAGEALADRTIAAWNDFDEAALRELYADDAIVFTSADMRPEASGIDEVVKLAQYGGLTVERIGPVTEREGLAWWPIHVSNTYDVAGDDAVAVFVLEDGRIVQHWVIWSER